MLTASEETDGFDVMEIVGRLPTEGCRWERNYPIAFGITPTESLE